MPDKRYGGGASEVEEFPTILLADVDGGWGSAVIGRLKEDEYHVLTAHSRDEALNFAKTHSRHIHLLLAEDSRDGHVLAETLKPYRPHMRVLYVTIQSNNGPRGALEPESAAAKVRELLRPPKTRTSRP